MGNLEKKKTRTYWQKEEFIFIVEHNLTMKLFKQGQDWRFKLNLEETKLGISLK